MLVRSAGIVLHKVKYSDNAIIVKIYTEKFGVQDFIVKNALSKSSKNKVAKWTNMALVEVVYNKTGSNTLYYPKEMTLLHIYTIIPCDMARNAILIFYNELLYKLLYEASEDAILFCFLKNNLLQLDTAASSVKDHHIRFLISLMQILGFSPSENYADNAPYFSIEAASFTAGYIDNSYFLSKPCSLYFYQLLVLSNADNTSAIEAPKTIRMELLHGLIRYFELHNDHLHRIESAQILSEVL